MNDLSLVIQGRWGQSDLVPLRHALLAAMVATIWGFNFVVITWGMHDTPPLLFAAIRFLLVVVPAIAVVPRPEAPWRVVLGVGAFMSLGQFSLLYLAIGAGMPSGIAALVLQAQIVFTIGLSAWRLGETPTRPQVAGVTLGALGLVIVALGRGGDTTVGGLLLTLLAALSWGIGNVISRSSGVKGGLSLVVWGSLAVPLPMLGLALVVDGPSAVVDALVSFDARAAASTLYTVVLATLVGYAIFNSLLARYPSAQVVPFVLIAPIAAAASGWALLGQRLSLGELAGGAVALAGLAVTMAPANRPWRRSRVLAWTPEPSMR